MFTSQDLLRYHELAHEGLGRMMEHVLTLPQEKFRQQLEGFAAPSVRAQLCHMLDVEAFWVKAIQGGGLDHDWEHAEDLQKPPELEAYRLEVAAATRRWLESESDEALNSEREVNDNGWFNSGVPAEMLLHLMTHAYHHKGQIAAMCRQLGHPAPMTDMVWIGLQIGEGEERQ
ncbi:DinB family protein [bacterium]|nr:DinB family protein [bacterium]